MKLLIPLLFVAALLQTSFLPINFVLVILICQSYLFESRANYLLAFIGGITFAILSSANLGFLPLIFLVIVKITHLVRKLPIVASLLTIPILVAMVLLLIAYLEQLIFNKSVNFKDVFLGAVASLPIYFLLQIWQDRLLFRNEIKLKIRN